MNAEAIPALIAEQERLRGEVVSLIAERDAARIERDALVEQLARLQPVIEAVREMKPLRAFGPKQGLFADYVTLRSVAQKRAVAALDEVECADQGPTRTR